MCPVESLNHVDLCVVRWDWLIYLPIFCNDVYLFFLWIVELVVNNDEVVLSDEDVSKLINDDEKQDSGDVSI